ncbi:uncharacterized protein LOC100890699 [Strongylocentrotus purpuratus]|uniref:Uncharacterized protein n=1 Tax=Strongylocentrotus purpuratus TaxID=7668 RepID=A0A7M7GJC6_STRPU|nr:uncharacterized protein LOC100890699 [Strongylocentrotus purpuratus]|eukprot:XP_003730846.1 PREDICTED: uncharacterized protein LOC100890699 [Strongylocentrotus purpuratus]
MKSVFIGAFLLACLSFGIGQGLECSACASMTTTSGASSLGECDEGSLPKITCYENQTSCARATIDGYGPFSQGQNEHPVYGPFNGTVWGCVGTPIDNTCIWDNAARSELLRGISNRPGDYGNSLPLFGNFLALLQSNKTALYGNKVCPCKGSICGGSGGSSEYGGNAGSLRTDVMIVLGFFLVAVFTKQS